MRHHLVLVALALLMVMGLMGATTTKADALELESQSALRGTVESRLRLAGGDQCAGAGNVGTVPLGSPCWAGSRVPSECCAGDAREAYCGNDKGEPFCGGNTCTCRPTLTGGNSCLYDWQCKGNCREICTGKSCILEFCGCSSSKKMCM